jgi:hypothetical protein
VPWPRMQIRTPVADIRSTFSPSEFTADFTADEWRVLTNVIVAMYWYTWKISWCRVGTTVESVISAVSRDQRMHTLWSADVECAHRLLINRAIAYHRYWKDCSRVKTLRYDGTRHVCGRKRGGLRWCYLIF